MKDRIAATARYASALMILLALLCSMGLPHHHHENAICLLIKSRYEEQSDGRHQKSDKGESRDICIGKKIFFKTDTRSKHALNKTVPPAHNIEAGTTLSLSAPKQKVSILCARTIGTDASNTPSTLRGLRAPPYSFL